MCIVVYFSTLPEVECSGVVQMLHPDVDQTVNSALCFTFLKLPAHVRTHAQTFVMKSRGVRSSVNTSTGFTMVPNHSVRLLCFFNS